MPRTVIAALLGTATLVAGDKIPVTAPADLDEFEEDDDLNEEGDYEETEEITSASPVSPDFDEPLTEKAKTSRFTACFRATKKHVQGSSKEVRDAATQLIENTKAQGGKALTVPEAVNFMVFSSIVACYSNIDQSIADSVAETKDGEIPESEVSGVFKRDAKTPQALNAEQQRLLEAVVAAEGAAPAPNMNAFAPPPLPEMSAFMASVYIVGLFSALGAAAVLVVRKLREAQSKMGQYKGPNAKERRKEKKKMGKRA